MSNLSGYNFDASTIEPSSFDPIPAGWYKAIISASEMKPTRDGYGEYLSLTLQVIEGQYANRLVFARLNLKNANDKAVDIARKDLAAICRAVGVMSPKASEELHDKPLMIKSKFVLPVVSMTHLMMLADIKPMKVQTLPHHHNNKKHLHLPHLLKTLAKIRTF